MREFLFVKNVPCLKTVEKHCHRECIIYHDLSYMSTTLALYHLSQKQIVRIESTKFSTSSCSVARWLASYGELE